MPYQKGQSGNPKGRPKKGTAMADALRTVLNKSEDGRQNKRAVAEKLVEMARSGNLEAMKLLFERVDGKVPETRVLEGSKDAPVAIKVVYDD